LTDTLRKISSGTELIPMFSTKMPKALLILATTVLLVACKQRTYKEGVESRLGWLLEPNSIPVSCEIKASTIDWGDEWPTYQIEVRMDESEFRKLVDRGGYRHEEFSESRLPYEQEIEIAEPFLAKGVFRRQVHELGTCSLFYCADPTRYFILYTHRP